MSPRRLLTMMMMLATAMLVAAPIAAAKGPGKAGHPRHAAIQGHVGSLGSIGHALQARGPGNSASEMHVEFSHSTSLGGLVITTAEWRGTRGLSHYTITDCYGNVTKVEVGGDHKEYTVTYLGRVDSITFKAGTTTRSFADPLGCDDKPVDDPKDPEDKYEDPKDEHKDEHKDEDPKCEWWDKSDHCL